MEEYEGLSVEELIALLHDKEDELIEWKEKAENLEEEATEWEARYDYKCDDCGRGDCDDCDRGDCGDCERVDIVYCYSCSFRVGGGNNFSCEKLTKCNGNKVFPEYCSLAQ